MENILAYEPATDTIRQKPQNYCIAVKKENRWVLDFDIAADKELVLRVCKALFEHEYRYSNGLKLLSKVTPNHEFKTHKEKFVVGKDYRFSELPEEDKEDFTINEYGSEHLGQNAIHIRYHKTEKDIWFIWHGQANEGIMKCVYNN